MVQVVKTENQSGLRFWFYEPAGYGHMALAEKRELAGRFKAAGIKPTRYGIRSRIGAHKLAMDVERSMGVPMSIQQHDYL